MFALHFWLVWVGPLPGDRWALRQEGPWAVGPWAAREAGAVIQYICSPAPALTIAAVGLLLLLWRGRPGEVQGLVIACLATPACALLKSMLGLEPVWATTYPHGAGSFPSGHVVFVTATIGYLGLCAWRRHMRWVSAVAVVLILWVGPERVLSGVHTVSDAVAGYLFAASFLVLADPGARSIRAVMAEST